jgi:glycerol kinase
MTPYEKISVFLAAAAIIISVIAYFKANNTATRANEIALGNIELYISERITNTKEKVSDVSLQMATLLSKSKKSADDEKVFLIYEKALNTAIENNLNAYEDSCAKYLDNKVDRNRFEKLYKVEIRQLVENDELKDYFDGVTSKYRAILKIYDKWENLEK